MSDKATQDEVDNFLKGLEGSQAPDGPINSHQLALQIARIDERTERAARDIAEIKGKIDTDVVHRGELDQIYLTLKSKASSERVGNVESTVKGHQDMVKWVGRLVVGAIILALIGSIMADKVQ